MSVAAAQVKPFSKDIACQTNQLEMLSVGTQQSLNIQEPRYECEEVKSPPKRACLEREDELEEDLLEGGPSEEASKGPDSTHDSGDSDRASLLLPPKCKETSTTTHHIKKYIVYENCLMELFSVCPVCKQTCNVRTQSLGTFLSVRQHCTHCTFERQWSSQPLLGSTPAGNLHLSAAVYLNDVSFSQVEKVFKAMELQVFEQKTFSQHARAFIEPAVLHHWKVQQVENLQRLTDKEVPLAGGMRVYSGPSAKYGSFAMLDLRTNLIVDIQLVQNSEASEPQSMEESGLSKSVDILESRGVNPGCIVTNTDTKMETFLKERSITQYFDIWHVAKGIMMQLDEASQQTGCEKLQDWLKSIHNHIYWTACSSKSGPMRIAKWTSLVNHIQDIHTHEDPLFPMCTHEIRPTRNKKKWLQPGTLASYKLEKVAEHKNTLKDIAKLSPYIQTSALEAYHAVSGRFVSHNLDHPYIGMLCRLYLAALHYNENVDQETAHAFELPCFKLSPKARRKECENKYQRTPTTFGYVADLMNLIFEEVVVNPTPYTEALLAIPVPEDS